jgi:chemotaxis protein MotB
MRATSRKTIALLISLVSLSLLSGCTNWQKKYQALLVQYENCKGQVDYERGEKSQLANRISQDQQTIEELQRQIEEKRKTPAVATGFGEGYDVAFDPNAGTITVTLPNAILFDSGKATLKTATSGELDHIYSVLQDKYRGKQIDVVGHTDTDPIRKTKDKWKDNWELSAERALTVTRYLIKRGIPVDKIRAIGCGESRPIASNSTVSGKAKNRRVEIVVHIRG